MKIMKKFIFTALVLLITSVPVFAQFIPGTALQDKTSLWTENDKGEMNWKMSVSWGTELLIKMDGDKILSKDAVRISDGVKSTRNFTQVTYDGKMYWVQTDRYSSEGTPRVMVEDAALYYSEDISSPSRFIVPKGAVVTEISTANVYGMNLKKIHWVEAVESYSVKEGYVYANKVGTCADDIKAINMLAKAKDVRDKASKSEILNNTVNFTLSPQVSQWIQTENGFSDFSKGKIEQENFMNEISGYYTVVFGDKEFVEVREIPGTLGNVIFECESPWVYVKERTVDMETINGNTNHWYHITRIVDFQNYSAIDGWIFGGNLAFDKTDIPGIE